MTWTADAPPITLDPSSYEAQDFWDPLHTLSSLSDKLKAKSFLKEAFIYLFIYLSIYLFIYLFIY